MGVFIMNKIVTLFVIGLWGFLCHTPIMQAELLIIQKSATGWAPYQTSPENIQKISEIVLRYQWPM